MCDYRLELGRREELAKLAETKRLYSRIKTPLGNGTFSSICKRAEYEYLFISLQVLPLSVRLPTFACFTQLNRLVVMNLLSKLTEKQLIFKGNRRVEGEI